MLNLVLARGPVQRRDLAAGHGTTTHLAWAAGQGLAHEHDQSLGVSCEQGLELGGGVNLRRMEMEEAPCLGGNIHSHILPSPAAGGGRTLGLRSPARLGKARRPRWERELYPPSPLSGGWTPRDEPGMAGPGRGQQRGGSHRVPRNAPAMLGGVGTQRSRQSLGARKRRCCSSPSSARRCEALTAA